MRYFNDAGVVSTTKNPLIHELDEAVKEARSNKKWRHDYMTWKMYGDEKIEEGLDLGLAALVRIVFSYDQNFDNLYKIICKNPEYANVSPEQVRKYYDQISLSQTE